MIDGLSMRKMSSSSSKLLGRRGTFEEEDHE
jgi:hypothetical protein